MELANRECRLSDGDRLCRFQGSAPSENAGLPVQRAQKRVPFEVTNRMHFPFSQYFLCSTVLSDFTYRHKFKDKMIKNFKTAAAVHDPNTGPVWAWGLCSFIRL